MAAVKIGKARCPLCGGVASVSLSKSQLPVLTMNCCQAQLFTRSDRSDMLVRGLMLPSEAPTPAPAPEKTAVAPLAPKPAAPAAAPLPVPEKKGFGLLGAW